MSEQPSFTGVETDGLIALDVRALFSSTLDCPKQIGRTDRRAVRRGGPAGALTGPVRTRAQIALRIRRP